ncbi:hypothetical protein GME_18393 [Halomonas sp. TD01]|nr:hypothetical protein GME_18393 [Halomonas sp. TD01]
MLLLIFVSTFFIKAVNEEGLFFNKCQCLIFFNMFSGLSYKSTLFNY